jgi:hypothetical protein
MVLTPSELEAASRSAKLWEIGEYLGEAVVFLACVGELIAEYSKFRSEDWRHSLGRRSLIALILGLGLGLVSLIKTNSLSGMVIDSLGNQIGEAGEKAQQASDASRSAISNSRQAEEESSNALTTSGTAKTAASTSLILARGARQEADTFEKRLGGAEHKADEAEQHLAETLKRATEAESEANRLKDRFSDRAINIDVLANDLTRVSGQSFRVTPYGNREPLALARQLFDALLKAGWLPEGQQESHGLFPGIIGLEVYLHPRAAATAKDAANLLVSALIGQGQTAVLKMINDPNNVTPNKNRIVINVGTKE